MTEEHSDDEHSADARGGALQVALAYHRAWTGGDFEQAMTYIADDIVCLAPPVASRAPERSEASWGPSPRS